MAYQTPTEVTAAMIAAGAAKIQMPATNLLLRGGLAGAILGFATSLAVTAAIETGLPIVGAILFPVGISVIVLLGLDLVTGNFGVSPLAVFERRPGASVNKLISSWSWVFLGNLLGSLLYALLLAIALTMFFTLEPTAVGQKIVEIAEAKTLGYAEHGVAGVATAFTKAILCNWMVALAVVMAMTATSVIGKVTAIWLPMVMFFAQGFEHAVVNMFVIPAGMILGAPVSAADWWLWNQIPVTLGNIVGGVIFVGLALYLTHAPKTARAAEPLSVEPTPTGVKTNG